MEHTSGGPWRSVAAADLPHYPRPPVNDSADVAPRSRLTRALVCLVGGLLTACWLALAVACLHDLRHLGDYPDAVAAGLAGLGDVAGLATGLAGAACAVAGTVAYLLRRRTPAMWLFLVSVSAPLFGLLTVIGVVVFPAR